jgi:hypothetical protein
MKLYLTHLKNTLDTKAYNDMVNYFLKKLKNYLLKSSKN